jgi:hypothetical protein
MYSEETRVARLLFPPTCGRAIAYEVAKMLGARHCLHHFPFSRLREKGSLQQYPVNILICDSPHCKGGLIRQEARDV